MAVRGLEVLVDALLFARVSRDSSGFGRSVEEQVADGMAWAAREGWNVVRVIRETGSASRFSSRRARAEWAEALQIVRSRAVDILLTWESSRATRDLSGFTELRDACVQSGVLWGYGRKVYNLTSRDDRFRTGLDALLAEDEVARTSERIQRAVDANAAAGRPHGRNLYGYTRVYGAQTRALLRIELNPETAPVVVEAYSLALEGTSLYAIAKRFNQRRIPPRHRKRVEHREGDGWTPVAVKQMLRNPGYAGLRQMRGEVIGPAAWEPIVSLDTWGSVQTILDAASRPRSDDSRLRHLLTGIARCGRDGCGAVLRSGRNSTRSAGASDESTTHYANYICSRSTHTSIAMHHLDALVTEQLLTIVSAPSFSEMIDDIDDHYRDERRKLIAELREMETWLEKVRVAAFESKNLEMLTAQERLVQPRIDQARRNLDLLTSSTVVRELAGATRVEACWHDMDLLEKRAAIRAVLDVRVHPAAHRGARGREQAELRTQITLITPR